jgi:hypothetical protein
MRLPASVNGALLVTCSLTAGVCSAAGGANPPYPLYCAGVTVGMSTKQDVLRMYGSGLSTPDEGHGGGLYYVDPKRQVTLHVEVGTDDEIESLSYSRGVHLPKQASVSVAKAVSTSLTPKEHVWLGIRLGSPPEEVIRTYGRPKSDHRSGAQRVMRYEMDYHRTPYVLDYEAVFRFEKSGLVSVTLMNGD